MATLVASAPLWFMDVQPEDLPELEHIAFAGYLEGLREAGWSEDARLAHLGCMTSVALRLAPLLGWFELAASNEGGKAWLQSFYTRPLDKVADQIAAIRRFALSRARSQSSSQSDGSLSDNVAWCRRCSIRLWKGVGTYV